MIMCRLQAVMTLDFEVNFGLKLSCFATELSSSLLWSFTLLTASRLMVQCRTIPMSLRVEATLKILQHRGRDICIPSQITEFHIDSPPKI